MTTAAGVLSVARSQIGVAEYPSGSNNQRYGIWYGMNYQPWCAMYVSWCFDRAGFPLPISTPKGFCYTPYGVNWAKAHGLWSESGRYAPADVIFYNFDSDPGPEHTGIVLRDDGRVVTVYEGNTSNAGSQYNGGEVCLKVRLHGPQVMGVLQASKLLARSVTTPPLCSDAPAFPLPAGCWYGVESADPRNHSGLSRNDWYGIVSISTQLRKRGWKQINTTQHYSPGVGAVVRAFQQEKHIVTDACVGPQTWRALWDAPVTR